MEAYIYQADLYCVDCATEIKDDIRKESPDVDIDESDETSFDSDDWPKGPYPDSGGDADSPQHCGGCGCFLENYLTSDGYDYVLSSVAEYLATGRGNRETIEMWVDFYDIGLGDLFERVNGWSLDD